ncbi:Meiosis specific protein SPO22 [Cordyceps fumosorosea ARSEF 2679]|uniref:Meiosis specific protein SPO22 n=1 Tax=Cordyceps fumosorosea (strain ARSEF 2679) TaxID=1081104 RepID=A0A162I6B7_CORFA|nr:Meiosis specific protein SPO22 [Cordyceps fumosorosea ARSEF 2679]OAA52865.1 Meiosis specific protein SPO22 [Cordyceps fumosorosea ARSEF 2679]
MNNHNLLPSSHRAALDKAVPMQLQTLIPRPDQEAIWDAFHLLDCVHFHADRLGPGAVHAIHTALWPSIQAWYENKFYAKVVSWSQLALHPALAAHEKQHRAAFLRRILAARIELGQYADAHTVLETLNHDDSDSNDNHLATQLLAFRLAVRSWDTALARSCLQSLAVAEKRETARDALYACVREAQAAGDRLCAVEALCAAVATWKGEVVVAGNVPALLRCAIRFLQQIDGDDDADSSDLTSNETVSLFSAGATLPSPLRGFSHAVITYMLEAAAFVADNARDDAGDAVFRGAELRWFAVHAYNIGVARCTLWPPGLLASLFQSCLVFSQALSSSSPPSEDDADATLITLRCHFVLASLYVSEARAGGGGGGEHAPSLYADAERHAAAFAALFAEAGQRRVGGQCPDLRRKLGVLCLFHCEALLARQSHEHLPCVVKQARLCGDVDVFKALGSCVIQSEAPVHVKSSILKSIVNEIFNVEDFKSHHLAQYLRCMVQVLLPMADDSAARDLLDQALQVAQESKQVGVAFPADEAEWLAAAAFNHGLTRHAAAAGGGADTPSCRAWMERAAAMARHVDDDGRFAASLQRRRERLLGFSLGDTL